MWENKGSVDEILTKEIAFCMPEDSGKKKIFQRTYQINIGQFNSYYCVSVEKKNKFPKFTKLTQTEDVQNSFFLRRKKNQITISTYNMMDSSHSNKFHSFQKVRIFFVHLISTMNVNFRLFFF